MRRLPTRPAPCSCCPIPVEVVVGRGHQLRHAVGLQREELPGPNPPGDQLQLLPAGRNVRDGVERTGGAKGRVLRGKKLRGRLLRSGGCCVRRGQMHGHVEVQPAPVGLLRQIPRFREPVGASRPRTGASCRRCRLCASVPRTGPIVFPRLHHELDDRLGRRTRVPARPVPPRRPTTTPMELHPTDRDQPFRNPCDHKIPRVVLQQALVQAPQRAGRDGVGEESLPALAGLFRTKPDAPRVPEDVRAAKSLHNDPKHPPAPLRIQLQEARRPHARRLQHRRRQRPHPVSRRQ